MGRKEEEEEKNEKYQALLRVYKCLFIDGYTETPFLSSFVAHYHEPFFSLLKKKMS